jgi:adenylate kinase family enzyme
MFVLVAGPPGSGKSTLARPLAEQLNLPLMAKDPIKEALMDVRDVARGDVAQQGKFHIATMTASGTEIHRVLSRADTVAP